MHSKYISLCALLGISWFMSCLDCSARGLQALSFSIDIKYLMPKSCEISCSPLLEVLEKHSQSTSL